MDDQTRLRNKLQTQNIHLTLDHYSHTQKKSPVKDQTL
jgi:hypothetical protein